MQPQATLKVRPEHLKGATVQSDRRRYKRIRLSLLGRFMRANKDEFPCRLVDISIGGARVSANVDVDANERIVVYFDELGGLEGTVVRKFDDGFAIDFSISHRKRQKLAAQLTWLLNRHEIVPAEQRRDGHDRITIEPRPIQIVFADGTEIERNAIDVSISGASIESQERPPLGSSIVVGRLRAQVVRHHSRGFGVEFLNVQPSEALRKHFG